MNNDLSTMNKTLCIIAISLLLVSPVRCSDDEEDEDLVVDFVIGVGIGLCQSSDSCNSFLSVVVVTLCICGLITCLCGDDDREDFAYNMPSGYSFGSLAAGSYVGGRIGN